MLLTVCVRYIVEFLVQRLSFFCVCVCDFAQVEATVSTVNFRVHSLYFQKPDRYSLNVFEG